MTKNEKAFLDMIAWAELGQEILASSDNGYNVLVGSLPGRLKLFHSYKDHPRVLVHLSGNLESTAAGRYQIRRKIYDAYKKPLRLPDFSPASQDAIALHLISECGARPAIDIGDIASAIARVRSRWASMPGAGYGQREHSYEKLLAVYAAANSNLAIGVT